MLLRIALYFAGGWFLLVLVGLIVLATIFGIVLGIKDFFFGGDSEEVLTPAQAY